MTNPIPFETRLEDIRANVVDIADFNERVVGAYNSGIAEKGLPADDQTARSVVPGGNGRAARLQLHRPRHPRVHRRELRGLHGVRHAVSGHGDPGQGGRARDARGAPRRYHRRRPCARVWPRSGCITNKYYTVLEKKGVGGGKFGIFIDPTKCKGCAECVDACGDHDALKMIRKNDQNLKWYRTAFELYKSMPETPAKFINEKALCGHDAGGAIAALRGRRRVLHGLRRGHGAAHDAGRHRLPLRPGKCRHRGRHRLQHGLHVDVSL